MRLIGMVHLPPLPGSPRWDGSMERAIAVALADARALIDNGMDALIIENYGDAPFTAGRVSAATVAAMAVIAHEIRRALHPRQRPRRRGGGRPGHRADRCPRPAARPAPARRRRRDLRRRAGQARGAAGARRAGAAGT